jgi:hypothetical protein
VKLRHTRLSLSAHGTWLAARLDHAPDVRGLILIPQSITSAAPTIEATGNFELAVTRAMQQAGFATFALDLLTDEEARDPDARFNVANLGERLLAALEWIHYQPQLLALPLGIFATDTAAAAAIRAAAHLPAQLGALAILAGRPDLAGAAPLRALKIPACFISGRDNPRADILRQAFELTAEPHAWQETPGGEAENMSADRLAAAAEIATGWMLSHLPPRSAE